VSVGARFIASGKEKDNLPLHPLKRGTRKDVYEKDKAAHCSYLIDHRKEKIGNRKEDPG
jgi:hypothetical protein